MFSTRKALETLVNKATKPIASAAKYSPPLELTNSHLHCAPLMLVSPAFVQGHHQYTLLRCVCQYAEKFAVFSALLVISQAVTLTYCTHASGARLFGLNLRRNR